MLVSMIVLSAAVVLTEPCLKTTPETSSLSRALMTFVDEHGQVDYSGIAKSRTAAFSTYLDSISRLCSKTYESLDLDSKAALLINFYNMWVLDFMSGGDGKPMSILKVRVKGKSIFDAPIIRVAWYPKNISLNHLEKHILKGVKSDPRIHMALVCGAKSCPKLRRSAFSGTRLNDELNDEVERFLSDPIRNQLDAKIWKVSKIFDWYRDDFGKNQDAVVKWILEHRKGPYTTPERLDYLEYDWAPNTQN